jgi:hypothetical protein
MIDFKNQSEVMAGLQARIAALDKKLDTAANQCLALGLNEVQNRAPVDTGNLKNSYPRCSAVKQSGTGIREITWTSDVDYQPHQELLHRPHLRPGIHAAIPAMKQAFQDAMKE